MSIHKRDTKMRLFVVFIALIAMCFAVSPRAVAGFEWLPPSDNPSPTPVKQTPVMPAPVPVPVAPVASPVPAVPVAPVTAVPAPNVPPTRAGGAVTPYPQPRMPSYAPQPMAAPSPRPVATPALAPTPMTPMAVGKPMGVPAPLPGPAPVAAPKKTALYINPYPMKSGGAPSAVSPEPASRAVNQALAEHAGVLHPLPLGDGQYTGAKPYRVSEFPRHAMKSPNKEMAPPAVPASISNQAMTPMMGGEPTPLSGMTAGGTAMYNNTAMTGRPMAPSGHSYNYTYTDAVGFGRNIPLSLALSQIVPSEFSRQVSPTIDQEMSVSWSGGKPWDQVLNDMLSEKNLRAEVHGNTVVIR